MNYFLDHVSLVVRDIEFVSSIFAKQGYEIGEKETFLDVGTEEIYIGNLASKALLLLQSPINAGVYSRAVNKRGYGIHHIAISTDDFSSFNEKLGTIGWFVHSNSLKDYKIGNTVFYTRPGVKTLIELNTVNETECGSNFIREVLISVDLGKEKYINEIGLSELKCSHQEDSYILIDNRKWIISEIE